MSASFLFLRGTVASVIVRIMFSISVFCEVVMAMIAVKGISVVVVAANSVYIRPCLESAPAGRDSRPTMICSIPGNHY